jgi:hypothetical protein
VPARPESRRFDPSHRLQAGGAALHRARRVWEPAAASGLHAFHWGGLDLACLDQPVEERLAAAVAVVCRRGRLVFQKIGHEGLDVLPPDSRGTVGHTVSNQVVGELSHRRAVGLDRRRAHASGGELTPPRSEQSAERVGCGMIRRAGGGFCFHRGCLCLVVSTATSMRYSSGVGHVTIRTTGKHAVFPSTHPWAVSSVG